MTSSDEPPVTAAGDTPAGDEPTDLCPSCGGERRKGAAFCHHCGVARAEAADQNQSNADAAEAASDCAPTVSEETVADDFEVAAGTPVTADTPADGKPGGHDQEAAGGAVVGSAAADPNLVCLACGTSNPPARVICGRCGADVPSGDTGMFATPLPDAKGPGPRRRRDGTTRQRGSWVLPVLASIAVLACVIGALVVLELGPFAPQADVPEAVYEPTEDDAEYLVLSDVATLTMREPEDDRSFTPELMVDDDPTTAWHSDASALPEGADETVDLFLEDPAWISAIVIENGDHFDAAAYADTARIQSAEFVFDGNVRVAATLLDQGLEAQIIEFDEPVLSTAVRLEVAQRVDGVAIDDIAISRLELHGFVADEDDAQLAEQRADAAPAAGAVSVPS